MEKPTVKLTGQDGNMLRNLLKQWRMNTVLFNNHLQDYVLNGLNIVQVMNTGMMVGMNKHTKHLNLCLKPTGLQ